MKNIGVVFLVGIVIGTAIGLCFPWCFYSDACAQPLLDICKHGFWDWALRVLEVLATLLAVLVALFKEDWIAYRFKPSLQIDKEHCDIYAKGANGRTDRYNASLVLSNVGRAKANNLKVTVDRIEYWVSTARENVQTVCSEPYDFVINGGSEQVCIPTDDEIRVELLSVLQTPAPKAIKGAVPPTPPLNLTIGQITISSEFYNGVIEVAITIKCDELKPQKHVLRIEWNGDWKEAKTDMQEVFSYKWLN